VKQYQSLGELLTDFRKHRGMTQLQLAVALGVEPRTLSRWENNDTLVKPEKEKDLVLQTFIPYQVIRNLNAAVPIPVFYNFEIRKYSLSTINNRPPTAAEFKSHIKAVSPRVRPIQSVEDIHSILEFYHGLDRRATMIGDAVITESVRVLPELNLILEDQAGYYAGHCVFFPISLLTYNLLKNKELDESKLSAADLVHYARHDHPVMYAYSIYADCNENLYFMMAAALRFLKKHHLDDGIIGGLAKRKDGLDTIIGMGFKTIWKEDIPGVESESLGTLSFMEGKIKPYLQDLK